MDEIDVDLLMRLQYGFRLTPTPFQHIADEMGLDEQEVLRRVRYHINEGTIVRIGVQLGHDAIAETPSALVALMVAPDSVDNVGRAINRLGEVKHNYLRDCEEFNVWFTVRARSDEELVEKVSSVTSIKGVRDSAFLQTKKVHKLDVKYDLRRGTSWSNSVGEQKQPSSTALTPNEKRLLKKLSKGISPVRRPLESIASEMGLSEDLIANLVDDYERNGAVKDVAAILSSEKIGFSENAMVVMRVPPEEASETCERIISEFPEITHCVERTCAVNWPYPCYAMIHGRRREMLLELADAVGKVAGALEVRPIFSSLNLRVIT